MFAWERRSATDGNGVGRSVVGCKETPSNIPRKCDRSKDVSAGRVLANSVGRMEVSGIVCDDGKEHERQTKIAISQGENKTDP